MVRKVSSSFAIKVLKIPEGSSFPEELEREIEKLGLKGGMVMGIGGFESLELGILNPTTREYAVNKYTSTDNVNLEGVSIIGNYFVRSDGKIATHIHVSIATGRGSSAGGHLIRGRVKPFLELFLIEVGEEVRRAFVHRDVQKK